MNRVPKTSLKIGVKVGDIMTREFISAKPEVSVLNAVKLMVKKRVGSLILIENDALKGMLTESDIMWALSKTSKKDLSKIKAIDICTRKVITIRPSADISDAIRLMRKSRFRRLPVTIKNRVIGLVTVKDILRIQPDLFELAKEGYVIKEYSDKLKRKKDAEEFKEGICEHCGKFDLVYMQDGRLICNDCKEAM
ncbi:MAG: cyclic nucleotide-binding/CBS domain-containing protein [Candidatus Nanoarchaeia archaeon]